jgi:hypothetical protein
MWSGPGAGGGGGLAEKARRQVQDVRVMSRESFASRVLLYSQIRPISRPIVVFPVTFFSLSKQRLHVSLPTGYPSYSLTRLSL